MEKIDITWEDIKALIPKKVSLHYVDYRESFDKNTELLELAIHTGRDVLYDTVFECYLNDYYGMDYVLTELKKDIESKFDIEDASDIMENYEDYIRDTIYDRDDFDAVKDLLRNTSSQTMFFDTGYEVEGESWCWGEERMQEEIRSIKEYLNIPQSNLDNDKNLLELLANATYGGQLVIYFYEDVDDFFDSEKYKTISFKNFCLAVINTGNGSGHDTQIKGITIELPYDKERIYLCKNIKYSYTFSVCGMSSDWCGATSVNLIETEQTRTLQKSDLDATLKQDAEYTTTFKLGKCTAGDMDITRHRKTRYVNSSTCGTICDDCGTFWID